MGKCDKLIYFCLILNFAVSCTSNKVKTAEQESDNMSVKTKSDNANTIKLPPKKDDFLIGDMPLNDPPLKTQAALKDSSLLGHGSQGHLEPAKTGNSDDDDCRDSDNDTICDSNDKCSGFDDLVDLDGDGLPLGCDCDDDNPDLGAVQGAARYVDSDNGSDNPNDCLLEQSPCKTITYALSQSSPGDTVVLAAATFLESNVVIEKNISIFGQGPLLSIVDAKKSERVFSINREVEATFCGLTIQNGKTSISQEQGGGIFGIMSNLQISNTWVQDNETSGDNGGGISSDRGSLVIINSKVRRNNAPGSGGGVFITGSGMSEIYNSEIANNSTDSSGGGIHINSSDSSIVIVGSTIRDNSALNSSGGGIRNEGTATISKSTISENKSRTGGGISNDNNLTINENTSIIQNTASNSGGGIRNNKRVEIINSTLRGNTAGDGGGIYNSGGSQELIVTNSTLSANMATSGDGGGIVNEEIATISNSTISGNSASSDGGGMINYFEATIKNSTITLNSATNGGGIFEIGDTDLNHTIVANQNSGGNCNAPLNLADWSLDSGTSCDLTNITGANNLQNTDPVLGPLQDNGGPTATHALLQPSSGAIDTGDTSCNVNADQRGLTRPVNTQCDIGAFEVQ